MTKTLKVQVLITARALIAEKKNWTQMAYARDEDGDEVCPKKVKSTKDGKQRHNCGKCSA